MKLTNLEFLEIEKKDNTYEYTYGVYATSLFKKHYFKFVFRSKLPHFYWKDIQSMMINQGVYFEDLKKGDQVDLKIGTLEYADFTESEKVKYGTNIYEWKSYLNEAVDKQSEFERKYNSKHGMPDLSGTGNMSDFDPNKEW